MYWLASHYHSTITFRHPLFYELRIETMTYRQVNEWTLSHQTQDGWKLTSLSWQHFSLEAFETHFTSSLAVCSFSLLYFISGCLLLWKCGMHALLQCVSIM